MLDKQSQGPAMYRLRFTNEADGDRASRGGPRPPLVHLSALPKGPAAHYRQYRDRGLGGATTRRGYLRDSQRVHDSKACKGSLTAPTAVKI
jgi:hypothetical protein